MGKKRTTKITIETERLLVVRHRGQQAPRWCPDCRAQTLMLKPEEAATIAAVTPRTIYRWVEAGQVHFTEAPDGWLLICLNSLPRDQA
jgi:hypothetical protein